MHTVEVNGAGWMLEILTDLDEPLLNSVDP